VQLQKKLRCGGSSLYQTGFEIFGRIEQSCKWIGQAGGENYNTFEFEDFFNMLEFFPSIGQVLDDLDSNDGIK
jgi:hypothetical protein